MAGISTEQDWIENAVPAATQRVHVVARDDHGQYVLPFLCRFTGGRWRNSMTGAELQIRVAGWTAKLRRETTHQKGGRR